MVNMNAVLNYVVEAAGLANGATKEDTMYDKMKANAGILDRKQYNKFVLEMQLNTTILADAAFKRMTREEEVLSGARIEGRVLQDGYMEDDGTNNGRQTKEDLKEAELDFEHSRLFARKLKAKTHLLDDDLDDNIEGTQFESTLQSMMGQRMGEDLEAIAVFGDTDLGYNEERLFHTFDGWIKMSNILKSSEYGSTNAEKAFNVHEDTIEALFDALIAAVPPRIRQSQLMNKYVIYVPYEVEDAYRNLLKSRNTQLGDDMQTGNAPLMYKRYKIKYAPVLDSPDCQALDNTATCMGAFPDTIAWGVYKDISMELERNAGQERTNFWYRMKGCAGKEVFSVINSAKLTLDELAVIQDEAKV
ncbi:phage major capsid protein [uncultured Methanobrevibacter sp.]|uniref:phage major capsid protein n=1 Tax=uncultured Methanobrevibacter sp. TaxID=253161 RepID=UPI0025EDEB77|nr:phage major capsid protein [uncultured Methanobrevibacter sp.]